MAIARLDPDLSTLQAATYLGGSGSDSADAIAIDSTGRIYVAGKTSGNFPVTTGGAQENYGGGEFDMAIARLDADLSAVQAATYLGGNDSDRATAIAIDSSGRVYVAGYTASDNFPVTTGGAQKTSGGGTDMAIARLDADLATLQAATYLGGSRDDNANAIAIDSTGRIYVAGYTSSDNFPAPLGERSKTLGIEDMAIAR